MATKKATKAKAPKKDDAKPSVIKTICTDLKLDPRIARRRLRAAGMKAPYENEAAIRKALTSAE